MVPEWLAKAEYDNFDLGRFRYDAAALIKYAIRAREKAEPSFLWGTSDYARWGLANIAKDRLPLSTLLNLVRIYDDIILGHMDSMGGSGGVLPDDPLAEFKVKVARPELGESLAICSSPRGTSTGLACRFRHT